MKEDSSRKRDLLLAAVCLVTLVSARDIVGYTASAETLAADHRPVAETGSRPDGAPLDASHEAAPTRSASSSGRSLEDGQPAASPSSRNALGATLPGRDVKPQAPSWDQVVLRPSNASEALATEPAAEAGAVPAAPPQPTPAPTWPGWSAIRALPDLPEVPRVRPRRQPANAVTLLDPSSVPSQVFGVHYAGNEATAGELLTGVESSLATDALTQAARSPMAPSGLADGDGTAWSVEVVYTSDHRFDTQIVEELIRRHERGFRIILRVDYERKQPIPPASDAAAVKRYAETFVKFFELTGGRVRYFVMGNEGNVDMPGDDPGRVTECLAGRVACSPENYVAVYRQVRQAIRTGTNGYLLVTPVSPGAADGVMRWIDGPTYLKGILDLLHPLEVDGIALHAYGDPLGYHAAGARPVDQFAAQVRRQLDVIAQSGYISTPVFVTEMNTSASDPGFAAAALDWIDRHNRASPQDILAACWFVYFDETGQWRDLALEQHPETLAAVRSAPRVPPGR